ncbi:MAG: glycerophosphodiester phosphodiesterase family protein [Balneolales bacterium]
MLLKRTLKDSIPRYAWRRVLDLWKPMAAWTLLVWVAVVIVLVPIFSSLIGWVFFRGDQLVVGNEELVGWLFTPQGFLYGVLTGALALMGVIIRYAGLFQIVSDDLNGMPVSVRGTALRIAPLIPKLFRLCLLTILATVIMFLPLVAGLSGIYLYFLDGHDINYYLSIRPPEWNSAIIAAGIWASIWFVGAAWVLCRGLLVLPAFLFSELNLREAIKESWYLQQKQANRLLSLMAFSLGLWLLVNVTVESSFLFFASYIIEWVASISSSLRTIVLVTGLYAASTLVLGAIIGFFGFSFSATVLTKFYYESIGVQIGTPSAQKIRRLPARTVVLARYWLNNSRVIPLIVILLGGSLALSNFLLERIPEQRAIEIFAHRGGPPPSLENTLAALEGAIITEAEFSEIDVQRTKDGEIVLIHDTDLMRVAGEPRRIAETDFADLDSLMRKPDENTSPEELGLATLDDYLFGAKDRIKLMIDLKYRGYDPELVTEVVRLVQKHDMEDDVIFMTMDLDAINQLKEVVPNIPRGYVSALAVGEVTQLPVNFLAIAYQRITPQVIRAAKEQGINIYAWTVNRADVMADMMELGVNGIITDDPALAARVREELKSMPPSERLLLRFRRVLADELDS